MARERDDRLVIWPVYFDIDVPRNLGRKMSKVDAFKGPRSEDIFAVGRKLGYSPELQDDKRHPSYPSGPRGRVLIRTSKKKSKVLKEIAQALQKAQR